MSNPSLEEIEEAIISSAYKWKDGWRFCDEQYSPKTDEEFKRLNTNANGNRPIGNLVYSDDCACQIDGEEFFRDTALSCGCICHKKSREFAAVVINILSAKNKGEVKAVKT